MGTCRGSHLSMGGAASWDDWMDPFEGTLQIWTGCPWWSYGVTLRLGVPRKPPSKGPLEYLIPSTVLPVDPQRPRAGKKGPGVVGSRVGAFLISSWATGTSGSNLRDIWGGGRPVAWGLILQGLEVSWTCRLSPRPPPPRPNQQWAFREEACGPQSIKLGRGEWFHCADGFGRWEPWAETGWVVAARERRGSRWAQVHPETSKFLETNRLRGSLREKTCSGQRVSGGGRQQSRQFSLALCA